jgi:hypothetical protein
VRLIAKELLVRHQPNRPVVAGFVTYVSATEPVLMHCYGWEDYSDGYDDYAVSMSHDNGKTWSEPVLKWQSVAVPQGKVRHAEPAALFDRDTGQLIVLTDKVLYPKDKLDVDAEYALAMDVYDLASDSWSERRELSFPGERCPAMSFSFPLKTSRGRLLFPGMRQTVEADGKAIHYRGCWAPVDEVVTVIGEYQGAELTWKLGQARPIDPERSSRGLDENALVELPDGRIAALCRGDNSMYPDRAGYKWLIVSSDDGESWSEPAPLPDTEGRPVESGANGSALFRSDRNGKLYWMANLCRPGEHARGNMPRTALMTAEMQEEPFALKRDTIFVIDERNSNDSPELQLSNFRFYQDRETGDVVLFMLRYCEHGLKEWWRSDYYRYRIGMEDA